MIVDDHAFVREMLRAAFEAEGFEVCEAINGSEAIRPLKNKVQVSSSSIFPCP